MAWKRFPHQWHLWYPQEGPVMQCVNIVPVNILPDSLPHCWFFICRNWEKAYTFFVFRLKQLHKHHIGLRYCENIYIYIYNFVSSDAQHQHDTTKCETRVDLLVCIASSTHWGRDRLDAISQTTSSSAFSWIKIFEFRLKFQWSLFLRVQLTIFQHWFR